MVTLLGEDIYGLVVEFGSHSTRVGFIGDDRPRVVMPSAYAEPSGLAGDLNLMQRQSSAIVRVIEEGEIRDWKGLEALWTEAVVRRLGYSNEQDLPPLVLVESPVLLNQGARERLCQVAFEVFKVPALFMAKTPVMVCFESGRHSGLVVDIGAGAVSVTPVYDGYVVKSSTVVQKGFGGEWLTRQLALMLQQDLKIGNEELKASLEVKSKEPVGLGQPSQHTANPTLLAPSVQAFHRTRMLDDCKESIAAVSEAPFSPAELAMRPPRYYEFPTGYNKNFVLERFRVGELLFAPQKYAWKGEAEGEDASFMGLTEMVAKSLAACDVDMRSTLVGNIIITGGGSLQTGLADRINLEFARFASYGRVRVHFGASNEQRKFGAWMGGSILGSLAATQQLWMTRKEYDENGPAAIERKFP